MKQIKLYQSFNLTTTFISTHSPAQWAGQYKIQTPLLLHSKLSALLRQQGLARPGLARPGAGGELRFGELLIRHTGHAGLTSAWVIQAASTKWKRRKKGRWSCLEKEKLPEKLRMWNAPWKTSASFSSSLKWVSYPFCILSSPVLTQSYLPSRGTEHKIRTFAFDSLSIK